MAALMTSAAGFEEEEKDRGVNNVVRTDEESRDILTSIERRSRTSCFTMLARLLSSVSF